MRLFQRSAQAAVLLSVFCLNLLGQSGSTVSTALPDDNVKARNPANMASTYVPLDSWVYDAISRLAALGYVQTDFAGQRPWTRMECARLVSEAGERAAENSQGEAEALYHSLANEFALELRREDGAPNNGFQVESIYSQALGIAGMPVTDGYHFAQTITNNFGRPYGEGTNSYSGAALRAQTGWLAFYLRGEYQTSGATLQPSSKAQAAIAQADFTATAADGPLSGVSRFELLDAYLSVIFKNNQLSFGKQSLWWGPGYGEAMLVSNNAPPITMLRYDRVSPFKLPGFLGFIGPIRLQFFIGQLSGQQFVNIPLGNGQEDTHVVGTPGVSLQPQPYIHGEKISIKPTPNLELSASRTTIFGGPGFPVTLGSFFNSFFSTAGANNGGISNDPGDRRVAFDMQYRIPGLRDWLTFYCDTFTDDEFFPLAYPTHSAWSPGIYLPKLPYLHKLDFRAEGAITPERLFPGFFYFNAHYLSGYTNDRQLIGSWVGRQGSGYQLWSTYWLSGRSTVQVGYRTQWVDHSFLQGGWLRDINANTNLALNANFSVQAGVQYERWQFPLLSPAPVSNITTSVQLSYTPRWNAHL
jgi:hypothetical protein